MAVSVLCHRINWLLDGCVFSVSQNKLFVVLMAVSVLCHRINCCLDGCKRSVSQNK